MSSNKKELKRLTRIAREQGWAVEQTRKGQCRKGQWWFRPPDPSAGQVLVAGTPSDRRAWKNAIAKLRQAGLDI